MPTGWESLIRPPSLHSCGRHIHPHAVGSPRCPAVVAKCRDVCLRFYECACACVHRGWDAKDAPLVDGTSPQIRRELTAGEDGAHSRGTTSPPLQQLLVEWTAAGLFFVRCERCYPPDSRRVPRNGAGVSLKLCAPKKENKSRPLVSSPLICTRRLVGHRLVARLHPNPRTRFDHRLARLPAGGMLAEPRRRELHTFPSQSSPDSGERGGKTRGLHFYLSSALRRAAHCDRALNGNWV